MKYLKTAFLALCLLLPLQAAAENLGVRITWTAPTVDSIGRPFQATSFVIHYSRAGGELKQFKVRGTETMSLLGGLPEDEYTFWMSSIGDVDINGKTVTKESELSEPFYLVRLYDEGDIFIFPPGADLELICNSAACDKFRFKEKGDK